MGIYAPLTGTTFSNGGSAGGTFYYGMNGSIKEFWGRSAALATGTGAAGTTYAITLPASFFTSITSITLGLDTITGDFRIITNIGSFTTSSLSVQIMNTATVSSSAIVSVFVRGL